MPDKLQPSGSDRGRLSVWPHLMTLKRCVLQVVLGFWRNFMMCFPSYVTVPRQLSTCILGKLHGRPICSKTMTLWGILRVSRLKEMTLCSILRMWRSLLELYIPIWMSESMCRRATAEECLYVSRDEQCHPEGFLTWVEYFGSQRRLIVSADVLTCACETVIELTRTRAEGCMSRWGPASKRIRDQWLNWWNTR